MRWQTTERYFRNMLAQKLEIPMVGKLQFAYKAGSQYEEWFHNEMDIPAELLHEGDTAIALAHSQMVANRNDVLLVAPGTYTGTGAAPITWSKDVTHMLGLQDVAPIEYGGSTVVIRTLSTSGIQACDISADRCKIQSVAFQNWGQATAAIAALKESGHQNHIKNCTVMGLARTNTSQNANCCSLWIATATLCAGKGSLYENCIIGDPGTPKRTEANGQILFGLTGSVGGGASIVFKGCKIQSWAEDVDPCAVKLVANYCGDRMMLFDRCVFYNFRENHNSTKPAYVIRDGCNTTHDILLQDCVQQGHTAWTNNATHCFISSGTTQTSAGGVAVAAA